MRKIKPASVFFTNYSDLFHPGKFEEEKKKERKKD